jgi:phage tail tape-measure protein
LKKRVSIESIATQPQEIKRIEIMASQQNQNAAQYKQSQANTQSKEELRNEDPISGAPGAHPVGTGVGAALGGALTGAAAGLAAGPVGTVVGTVVGGIAGGLAGKAIAEDVDPTVETAYWKEEYTNRPYYSKDYSFEDYEPAYRSGWESYDSEAKASWTEREKIARERWENEGGHPRMTWEEAKRASEDAYVRLHSRRNMPRS